jgi:hypothetical protein
MRSWRKLNTLTASPGRVVVGGVPAFDPENYSVVVGNGVVIYNQDIISEVLAAIDTLARILGDGVRKVILDYPAAKDITACSTTTRPAKAKPRLKWEKERREGENPAQFAWRAYAVEAAAGTLHRGLIRREDPELHRRLNRWLCSHPMPEGIDIPTKAKWHTRLLTKRSKPLRPRDSIATLGPPPAGAGEKICSGCGVAKPIEAFYRRSDERYPERRHAECIDCMKARNKRRYELKADDIKLRSNLWMRRNRERKNASNRNSYARGRERAGKTYSPRERSEASM